MTVIPRVPFSRSRGSPRTAPPELRPALGAGIGQRPACLARLHVAGGADRVCAGGHGRLLRRAARHCPAEGLGPRPRQRPASAREGQRPGEVRNEPMVALMLPLARRAGEAASLLLEDVDWRLRMLSVRGRGNRLDRVPFPADIGRPLARYLRSGGPARDRAPAGVPGPGCSARAADRPSGRECRHPCNGLRRDHGPECRAAAPAHRDVGGVRPEAGSRRSGKVTVPNQPYATTVYARSDIAALRSIARPWPGAAR